METAKPLELPDTAELLKVASHHHVLCCWPSTMQQARVLHLHSSSCFFFFFKITTERPSVCQTILYNDPHIDRATELCRYTQMPPHGSYERDLATA